MRFLSMGICTTGWLAWWLTFITMLFWPATCSICKNTLLYAYAIRSPIATPTAEDILDSIKCMHQPSTSWQHARQLNVKQHSLNALFLLHSFYSICTHSRTLLVEAEPTAVQSAPADILALILTTDLCRTVDHISPAILYYNAWSLYFLSWMNFIINQMFSVLLNPSCAVTFMTLNYYFPCSYHMVVVFSCIFHTSIYYRIHLALPFMFCILSIVTFNQLTLLSFSVWTYWWLQYNCHINS